MGNTMKKLALFMIGLLLSALFLAISCTTTHPAGWPTPRKLTDAEKAKVTASALETPEVIAQLKKESVYKESLGWIAIVWNGSQISSWRVLDYDWETDPNFALVDESALFYVLDLFNFGEPPNWQIYIAVNPDTGKAFTVTENPFRTGPTP